MLPEGGAHGRLEGPLALLSVAAYLVHELGMPEPVGGIGAALEPMLHSAIEAGDNVDRTLPALQVLYAWAAANERKFWERHKDSDNRWKDEPAHGWAGAWKPGSKWDSIAFTEQTLRRVLTDAGFDADAVWTDLCRRRFTTHKSAKHKKRARKMGTTDSVPLICIKKSAFDEAHQGGHQVDAWGGHQK
jgi:hypothetical protein